MVRSNSLLLQTLATTKLNSTVSLHCVRTSKTTKGRYLRLYYSKKKKLQYAYRLLMHSPILKTYEVTWEWELDWLNDTPMITHSLSKFACLIDLSKIARIVCGRCFLFTFTFSLVSPIIWKMVIRYKVSIACSSLLPIYPVFSGRTSSSDFSKAQL